METKIILASASPRRKELLRLAVSEFDIITEEVDEDIIDKDLPVHIYVQELALLKASAVAKSIGRRKNTLIIGADTVVYNDGEILGKPHDPQEAVDMLGMLSGKTHSVYTGVCVMDSYSAKIVCIKECTNVKFKELSPDDIMAYIGTGEPMDKAGAYGIQGKGALLVSGIEGDYNNVVGLPVSALADLLKNEFEVNCMNR